jgi:membrane-bound inhibitor of C-type lysozyme
MKNTLFLVALVALIGIGAAVYAFTRGSAGTEQQAIPPFETSQAYLCAHDAILAAGFSEGQATVVLDDGRVFTLEQTASASGVRYANTDDQIVFFTKGDEAFLEENGIATYTGCMAEGAESPTENPDGPSEQPNAPNEPPQASNSCYVGGCSGHICSDDPDVVSTCEWHESYACYDTATCERQVSGECGWTETAELTQCLQNAQ